MKAIAAIMLTVVVICGVGCKKENNGNTNGHAYVDLDLPSGLLWATCNIGANAPEDYGDYFAWGETKTKDTYNWSTYKWCKGDYDQLTKYCNNSSYGYNGFTDKLSTLKFRDDAARANWGGDWRMPTIEEWGELMNYTTWVWTMQNGVYGKKITASNGNSLFLPAAGCCGDDSLNFDGTSGRYWSSSLISGYPDSARILLFGSGYGYWSLYSRYFGLSVRAVLATSKN